VLNLKTELAEETVTAVGKESLKMHETPKREEEKS
jgi:hypothetical protein